MSYLWRFLSLRYWLRHRGAFVLSTLGVALGLAVFVSVQVANHSVLASFAASLDAVSGKANLQIRGGSNGLPEDLYVRLQSLGDPRLRAAAPLLSKTLFSPTFDSTLLVMGVDVFAETDFRQWDADANANTNPSANLSASARTSTGANTSQNAGLNTPGQLAQFLLNPRALAVSEALARKHNLKPGNTVELFIGARRETFTVFAVLRGEERPGDFGGDFALLDIAAAQEAFGQVGRLSQIDLIVDEARLDATAAALRPLLPADATVQRPAQRGAQVADLLAAFQLNLSALSCISLFVGAFLIYNAIAIAVVRRRVEIGTLRAVGAARGQLMRMFTVEAALIGLAGSVAGFALGLVLARFTLHAVSATVSALYIAVRAREIVVPPWLWWGAPLGGTLLATLAALPAAWEAANTSPRAALQRLTLHHATTRHAAPLAIAGLAALGLAFALCHPLVSGRTVFAGFIASFFTLGGFALLTPLLTLWGGRLAQHAARRGGMLVGVEGALAATYLQRALNRSALVIAALMVSLAMTIGLSVMVRSFRQTVAGWVETTIGADLYVAPATGFVGDLGPGLPPEVVRHARGLPGLSASDTVRSLEIQIGKQPVAIAACELPALLSGERRMRFLQTVAGEEAAKRALVTGRAVLVSERFKNLIGPGAGDTLRLPTPRGPLRVPVAGVFYDYTPNQCLMYLPRALYRKYWGDDAVDGVALYFKKGADAARAQAALNRKFGRRYQLTLLPNGAIRRSVFETFDQTFAVTYALQLIAVIVAAIGIFDTLIALLLERGRELATLRALGASGAQIQKMTFIEFALIGFFAWAIGLAAGLCLAWQLIYVINRQFFGWTIEWTVPPAVLAQALGLALLAALGAGALPARAAARRNIAEALQTE